MTTTRKRTTVDHGELLRAVFLVCKTLDGDRPTVREMVDRLQQLGAGVRRQVVRDWLWAEYAAGSGEAVPQAAPAPEIAALMERAGILGTLNAKAALSRESAGNGVPE